MRPEDVLVARLNSYMWQDMNGSVHIEIPALLQHYDIEDTLQNRLWAHRKAAEILEELHARPIHRFIKPPSEEN